MTFLLAFLNNGLKKSFVLLLSISAQQLFAQQAKPNILFIAIDDLKPILGCYGDKIIKTPNIDRLAKMGTVFMNNYCQQAVCGPTRASLMTGKRPDHTKVWDLKTKMRDVTPDLLSLPQYLISQGYSTQGIGKIFDPRDVDKKLDEPSWSVPFYKQADDYLNKDLGEPALGQYQLPATKLLIKKYEEEAATKGLEKKEARTFVQESIFPTTECVDVPDNAYEDGATTLRSIDILKKLQKSKQPFFFAVGLHKPHLPFVAPKKYWDLYSRKDMPLAAFQDIAKNGVDIAFTEAGEIRKYTDIPPIISSTEQKKIGLTLSTDKQQELIHGYYAAVSYSDALVGLLLNTLDSLQLTKNTIIVLWGDHGWHLGDHNLWCKHTNFEQATHAPLIISSPNIKPSITNSTTEFVDVFPTLCELSGVEIPKTLDGVSLVAAMKKPNTMVKEFAVSQYPRTSKKDVTKTKGFISAKCMGYSIRTSKYRYTIWMGNDFRSTQPFNADYIVASEMYDYEKDPNETVNIVDDKNYTSIAKEMYNKMIDFFNKQASTSK
jgi:iduronate 2-sulfatase